MEWLSSTNNATKVPAMLALFVATEADKKCRTAVAYYSQKAFDSLKSIDIEAGRKEHLIYLANELLNREK